MARKFDLCGTKHMITETKREVCLSEVRMSKTLVERLQSTLSSCWTKVGFLTSYYRNTDVVPWLCFTNVESASINQCWIRFHFITSTLSTSAVIRGNVISTLNRRITFRRWINVQASLDLVWFHWPYTMQNIRQVFTIFDNTSTSPLHCVHCYG